MRARPSPISEIVLLDRSSSLHEVIYQMVGHSNTSEPSNEGTAQESWLASSAEPMISLILTPSMVCELITAAKQGEGLLLCVATWASA